MPTLSAAEIARHARAAGWSGADVAIATAVALAESGGRTDVISRPNSNGTRDYGLWQINSVHNPTAVNWSDPAVNARLAYGVWQRQGWGIVGRPGKGWTAYSTGAYKLHLPAASAAAGNPFGLDGGSGSGNNPLVPDFIEGPADAVSDTAAVGVAALKYVDAANKWVRDPENWVRVAKVVVGIALLYAGLTQFAEPVVKPVRDAVIGATKTVATKGRAK